MQWIINYRRRRKNNFLGFLCAMVVCGGILRFFIREPTFPIDEPQRVIQDDGEFVILWYGAPAFVQEYLSPKMSSACSVNNCNIIISRREDDLYRSDVVIFTHDDIPDVPPLKPIGQRWIFFTMENPYFTRTKDSLWHNKFDWLMSYRRDSHFLYPYSIIRKRKKPFRRNYTQTFRYKRKDAVWMSGHCPVPSKRKVLATKLSEFMEVDMFGPCGTEPCGNRTPFISDCLNMVSKNYKFYFSFENAICTDYSTEKLFNMYSYSLGIIPVINGPVNAKEYLPQGTYINALDYRSAEELAKALNEIGLDEEKYVNYLREKDKYFSVGEKKITDDTMCDICMKLNTREGPTYMIENIAEFWSNRDCIKPSF